MAHFAQIDHDNVVLNVTVVNNEDMRDEKFLEQEHLGVAICRATVDRHGRFIQTSYNGNFRGKYAAVGDIYDEDLDEFVSPQAED